MNINSSLLGSVFQQLPNSRFTFNSADSRNYLRWHESKQCPPYLIQRHHTSKLYHPNTNNICHPHCNHGKFPILQKKQVQREDKIRDALVKTVLANKHVSRLLFCPSYQTTHINTIDWIRKAFSNYIQKAEFDSREQYSFSNYIFLRKIICCNKEFVLFVKYSNVTFTYLEWPKQPGKWLGRHLSPPDCLLIPAWLIVSEKRLKGRGLMQLPLQRISTRWSSVEQPSLWFSSVLMCRQFPSPGEFGQQLRQIHKFVSLQIQVERLGCRQQLQPVPTKPIYLMTNGKWKNALRQTMKRI